MASKKSFIFKNVSKERKTFRVGESQNIPFYEHAYNMWEDRIDWDNVKRIVELQCHGSQAEADRLADFLTIFKQIASSKGDAGDLVGKSHAPGAAFLNQIDREMLQQIEQESPMLVQTLLGTITSWKGSNSTKTGSILENFIQDVIQKALIATDNITNGQVPSIQVGGQQVATRVKLGSIDVWVPKGESLFKANGKEIKDSIWEDIKSTIAPKIESEMQAQIINQRGNQYGRLYTIEVRQGTSKQQKIDDIAEFDIIATPSPMIGEFLKLVQHKTFSAKNYSFNGSPTIERFAGLRRNSRFLHLGSTEFIQRKYGSFYFAATGSENGADIGTFIFSTEQASHKVEVLDNYMSWVDLLYEAMGIGQQGNNRLVDYLVINDNSNPKTRVLVISLKDYVRNFDPAQKPDLVLDSEGDIVITRRYGQLYISN